MKYVADGMLGRLTRWLRLTGQDVVSVNDFDIESSGEDDFLLDLAEQDSRVLLTRDVDLHRRALRDNLKTVLIREENDVAKQMFTISNDLDEDLAVDITSSRCSICNGGLKPVDKSDILDKVPEGVIENNEDFWVCEDCGKVYWLGSHWEKIAETIERYRDMR